MKKTRKNLIKGLATVATFACLVASVGGLASCKVNLSMPTNLVLQERTLTWDEVRKATKYVVEVNGKEYETKENSYTLEDYTYGVMEMRVKAVYKKNESAYSPILERSVSWTLETPTDLKQDGTLIRWEEVQLAQGYIVNVNGVHYETEENVYNYTAQDATIIKVLACGNEEGTILDSAYSEELRVVASLSAPQTTVSGTVLSWKEIKNASAYEIYVDGEKLCETQDTEYDFDWLYVGQIKVAVKAVSDNELYEKSALSKEKTITLYQKTLFTPENVRLENGTLVWDEVKGGTGYTVFNNGAEYASVQTNAYEIPQELLGADVSLLQIRAESQLHNPSELSDGIDVGVYSENNPILIETAEEFMAMNETYHYKLANDLDLSSYTLTERISVFKGSLDGNGHKITNLSVALFDTLDGGKVKNLTVENATISLTLNKSGARVGTLANTTIGATIENCVVSATLSVTQENGVGYVGGIVGISEYSTMRNLSFTGSLTTNYCVTGGFVGKVQNSERESEMIRCSAEATITLTGGETTPCGGFIGQFTDNYLTVKESKAVVEIQTNASYCGGFVGYMGTGKIVDCYASGSLTNTNTSMARIGGFIGRTEGYNNRVVRCISMMSISAQEQDTIYVGGFVGNTIGGTYANVYENCFYDNTLASIDRIGNTSNGKGDGIEAKSTNGLKNLAYEKGYSADVWALGNGELPALVRVDTQA